MHNFRHYFAVGECGSDDVAWVEAAGIGHCLAVNTCYAVAEAQNVFGVGALHLVADAFDAVLLLHETSGAG